MLAALTPESDRESVLVRVTRIWEAVNKHTGVVLHTNVLLMDQEGYNMVATIRNNQKQIYLPLLKEGVVYKISNFKVVQGPKQYRTADTDRSINFFYRTKISMETDRGIIPRYKFELKDFDTIGDWVGNVTMFIDVLGMVTTYGQMERRLKGAQKMDVVLNNVRSVGSVYELITNIFFI